MKTSSIVLACLAITLTGVQAQVASPQVSANQSIITTAQLPRPTAYRVVDRGANHKVWQRETYEPAPDGRMTTHVHKYTELAAGLHYQKNGQWVESREQIESYRGGAIARQGQHQVIFANNLNSAGAIDMQTPDGKRLRSNILGLAYYDSSTGQSVLIAQIQDCQGELISANQVLYPNAFEGVRADVRYTYKKGGFEQDVILLEQPPTPESYGLNSATTEIEVMTEFIQPPKETIKDRKTLRNGQEDQDVSWGVMQLGHGKAFDLGEPQNSRKPVSVKRHYGQINGRNILLEIVPILNIQSGLQKLPLQSSLKSKLPTLASKTRFLPKTPLAQAGEKPIKMAAVAPADKGYVLDYVVIDANQTNYTFQCDTTYYVSGEFNLTGTTTIEGGTVIKYNTGDGGGINILGVLNCLTGPYRPAVFTSADDNTLGENVNAGSGSTCTGSLDFNVVNESGWDVEVNVYDDSWYTPVSGAVSTYDSGNFTFTAGLSQHYYFEAYDSNWNCYYWSDFYPTLNSGTITLASDGWSVAYTESGDSLCTPPEPGPTLAMSLANGGVVHDVRFCNLSVGISSADDYSVTDAQFVNCGTALQTENASLYAGNILMSRVGTAFYGQYFQVTAENVTFDQGTNVTDDSDVMDTTSAVMLTNALLTAVVDYGVVPVAANHVVKLSSSSGVYQAVVGGNYYLATNSPYRNAGTANIDSSLLAGLQTKTTYPPIAYSNTPITEATTFSPQAQRDTDTPDLGYHYDPLDYVFANTEADADITFIAGTAVGWFRTTSGWGHVGDAIHMLDNVTVSFNGTATAPDYFVRCTTVQEQDLCGGYGYGGLTSWASDDTHVATVQASFTRCTEMTIGEGGYFRDDGGHLVVNAFGCEFYGGDVGAWYVTLNMTNCLFYRYTCEVMNEHNDAGFNWVNCTSVGRSDASLVIQHWGSSFPAYIVNCAFQNCNFGGVDTVNAYFNYNAFDQATNQLPSEGANTIVVTNGYNWQSSWLGDFYLPANSTLINEGSPNADQLGLYHFTTQTSQVKETNSIVDIGYHYVATDSSGNPLDSNGNGNPDYMEDYSGIGQALTITLLTPTNNAFYAEPATIPLQASVFDWRSVVTNVDFSRSAVQIITVTNAPFQYSWPVVAAGIYSITATASDLAGTTAATTAVSITVTNACGSY